MCFSQPVGLTKKYAVLHKRLPNLMATINQTAVLAIMSVAPGTYCNPMLPHEEADFSKSGAHVKIASIIKNTSLMVNYQKCGCTEIHCAAYVF